MRGRIKRDLGEIPGDVRAGILLTLAVIVFAGVQPFLSGGQKEEGDVTFTEDHRWVHVDHESGIDYLIRTSSITAFVSPIPGDPHKKNGVMLIGGHIMSTTLDIEEFASILLEDERNTVKRVELK